MTQLGLFDVTENKHDGNPESVAANKLAAPNKNRDRERILELIEMTGAYGLTCREAAEQMETGMNNISGRFTELKASKRIRKIGLRDKCAVYVCRDTFTELCYVYGHAGFVDGYDRECMKEQGLTRAQYTNWLRGWDEAQEEESQKGNI